MGDTDRKEHLGTYPSAVVRPFNIYGGFIDQNRPHHPPAPLAPGPFPGFENGGGSTKTVLLNNPSRPVGSSGGKSLCLLNRSSSPSPSRERTGADSARRNGFTLSFFGEGFVGVQSIASGSSTSFSSSIGEGGFWSEGEPKIGFVRIVAKGLFESVKEPNKSDSCTCCCRSVGKRGAGPGGREDERVADVIVVGSIRRIEGDLTTLSVTKEMSRTCIPDKTPVTECQNRTYE